MSYIELENLTYSYPDLNDPNFKSIISSKKEFKEVEGTVSEKVPERGKLFRHQKFLLRYMLEYDRIYMIWEPGTGKSCGALAVPEHFRKLIESPYQRAYYIAKGPSLVNEFKKQLVCKCNEGEYEKIAQGRKITSSKLRKEIEKYYTMDTYIPFIRKLINKTDEMIMNEYSGSIFIMDEIHNLNVDIDATLDDDVSAIDKEDEKEGLYDENKKKEMQVTYEQIKRLFRLVKRSKIILMSATPMINKSKELGPIMNLILPEDNQIPAEFDWSDKNYEEVEKYFRGNVSYVRALDTGITVEYMGGIYGENEINGKDVDSQMVIYPVIMSPFQSKHYYEYSEKSRSHKGAFYSRVRQAANIIYPDGTPDSLLSYVNQGKKLKNTKNINEGQEWSLIAGAYSASKEFTPYLTGKKLKKISAKDHEIVDICKKSKGNCWIYSNFVLGGGAVQLGIALEKNGFEKFDESVSIFTQELSGGLCESTIGRGRNVRITKKPRYALLIGGISPAKINVILEAQNSPENVNGEYLKVLIGSRISRDGLNLSNVLTIIMLESGWNRAANYQAENRAIRSTSHVEILKQKRNEYQEKGLDPNDASVIIKMYRMVAIPTNSKGEEDYEESIDILMYKMAETKDIEIKKAFRLMKECAVDCKINYKRNVREDDDDYSYVCDYDLCNYDCHVKELPTDTSSYDVLYSQEKVDEIKTIIKNKFNVQTSITLINLYKEFSKTDATYVEMAINDIIINKEHVVDKYGYISYIRNDKGYLYLQRTFPLSSREEISNYNLSIYNETLLGFEYNSLYAYVNILEEKNDEIVLNELKSQKPGTKKFKELFSKIRLELKIKFFENSIIEKNKGKESDIGNAVIKEFSKYLIEMNEPISQIKGAKESLNKEKRVGKPPTKHKQNIKIKNTEEEEGELVYLHNLLEKLNTNQSTRAYNETSNFIQAKGIFKIYKPSENIGWRGLTNAEEYVYHDLVKKMRQEELQEFEKYKIYGMKTNNNFKIVDKRSKANNKGRNCKSYAVYLLIDILWEFRSNDGEYDPFKFESKENREKMIEDIKNNNAFKNYQGLEDFEDEKLGFYYLASKFTREKLCKLVEDYLQKNNRIKEF